MNNSRTRFSTFASYPASDGINNNQQNVGILVSPTITRLQPRQPNAQSQTPPKMKVPPYSNPIILHF
jgi:hypothetical protein